MRIKPNKVVLEGRVERIVPAADGFGAEIELRVKATRPASGFEDFLGAAPGETVTLFAAEPEKLAEGKSYRIAASVHGGPDGERAVIETAQAA